MDQHQITPANESISCHAWNADRTMCAICPNSNELHIYSCTGSEWEKLHVLNEHDLLISAVDWSAANNKIVTCSHDRNAFVWTYSAETNKWNPTLVILRIDRAALDVKWALDGLRFAVSSGAKTVPVCTYEAERDWWVSKIIKKKFKSTVLCVSFHPIHGQLLATGSSDFKCRVYSTFSSDVDSAVDPGPFGTPQEFGEAYVELSCQGWVNAVAWTPSGSTLCFSGHDSSLSFATFSPSGPVVQILRHRELPFSKLLFVSERALTAVGHNFKPAIFAQAGNEWSFYAWLDQKKEEEKSSSAAGGVAAARALFQNKASRGQESKGESDTLWTQHEKQITDISIANPSTASKITKISTSGLDGRLVVWDMEKLSRSGIELSLATLGI